VLLGADITGSQKYVALSATSAGGVIALPVWIAGQVDSNENMLRASGTPLITVTPYVANGTVGNVIEFTNMARVLGGGGILQTALVNDDAGQNALLELWLFNQTFTPTADTIQFVISEGDMDNRIAVIDFAAGTYKDGGTVSGATRGGLGIAYTLTGTSMFGVFVTRGTPDYVATDDLTAILVTIPD